MFVFYFRFVSGLQEKQKQLEEEANAFAAAFRSLKGSLGRFAAGLAACNVRVELK